MRCGRHYQSWRRADDALRGLRARAAEFGQPTAGGRRVEECRPGSWHITPPVERCEKVTWPTREAAMAVVLQANIRRTLHGNQRRRESRAYGCLRCLNWHLTSRAAPRRSA